MQENKTIDHLVVIWTSGDKEVAQNMVFMYSLNSKLREWWGEVTLVVWGPSAKLLASDAQLHDEIRIMKNAGVKIEACRACTDRYGVSATLEELGIEVKYMGEPLTRFLKEGYHVITF